MSFKYISESDGREGIYYTIGARHGYSSEVYRSIHIIYKIYIIVHIEGGIDGETQYYLAYLADFYSPFVIVTERRKLIEGRDVPMTAQEETFSPSELAKENWTSPLQSPFMEQTNQIQ